MRRVFLLILTLALLAPAQASAKAYQFNVPRLVDRPLTAVERVSKIPVLLPSRMTVEFRKLYSSGSGKAGSYTFDIGSVRGCRSATACFVAAFHARRGGRPSATQKVRLSNGRTGYFRPLRCGASCAAPSMEWIQGGVLYVIEAKLGTVRTEERILTRLANSAIRNGAR